MIERVVIICVALLAPMACVNAAEPGPAASPPAKAAKRKAKPAKPPAPKGVKPLHLALNRPGFKNHRTEWHLENVAAPELNLHGQPSGVRALAMVGPLDGDQHVEFGVAPLVPSKPPLASAGAPDGTTAGPSWRALVPGAQVYLRYRW